MDVRRVAVPTDGVPGGATNAYVVGSDPAVLVDPPAHTDELETLVRERGVAVAVATHAHPDHVGGLSALADAHDLEVYALAGHEERFADATGRNPTRTVRAGAEIPVGTEVVTVLETPGHAPDHLSLALPDGSILCGDVAIAVGSVVVGHPEGDMRAYLDTLRRLRDLNPPTLYPGHGPVIEDPDATLTRLVDHRLERERRVLEAVEAGAQTPDAIVDAAYDKDLTGVRSMAEATVVAHLEKLAAEGAVDWDGERARPA